MALPAAPARLPGGQGAQAVLAVEGVELGHRPLELPTPPALLATAPAPRLARVVWTFGGHGP